jgi:flagellar biosynthetic protein FliR
MTLNVDWLPQTAYVLMIIFARVGAMLMLLPALGEVAIPARIRLGFALAFTIVLYPLLVGQMPALPDSYAGIGATLAHELAVGLILGGLMRFIVMATEVAGASIAFMTGLSFAQTADPSQQGVQGVAISTFLSMLGVTLIFATDLHHLMLAAIVGSYRLFSPTDGIMWGDAAHMAVDMTAQAFVLGVQMSTPFIVFGLVFSFGLGILSRLMPQMQVFFLAMPANIFVGFILFALLLMMMTGWYLTHIQTEFQALVR